MHIGEISFCNRIGFNVKSDDFKKKILDDLSKFGCKIIQKHHDKFNENGSMEVLNSNPHLMTLRSNGNPYYLFLTKHDGINQCIFIDKKVQQGYINPRMVIVKFWFNDALFSNTLFTGEMVKSDKTGAWTFLLHDMLADCGESCNHINLVKRLNRTYEVLSSMWKRDPRQDVSDIRVKRYFHYDEYETMMAWSKKLPYTCRGIYFKPLFLKFRDILFNFDDTLIKKNDKSVTYNNKQFVTKEEHAEIVKEKTKSIVWIQKTSQPDIYQVFVDNKDAGLAFVNNIRVSKMLRERFVSATPVDKVKYTANFNSKFKKWEPIEEVQGNP